jgi:hypothetical protein
MIYLPNYVKDTMYHLSRIYQHQILLTPIKDERDFIKKTVDFFSTVPPIHNPSFSISFRSKKTDNTYFAWLQHPRRNCNNPDKEELGDFLLIVKFFSNGQYLGKTATLIQAKFSQKNNWTIDNRQFDFMLNFPDFTLGNKRSQILNPLYNRIFSLKPRKITWSNYVFANPQNNQISQTTHRINRNVGPRSSYLSRSSFSYTPESRYSSFQTFLYNLMISRYGEFLLPTDTSDINALINTIYRHNNWDPDPPAEFVNENQQVDDDDLGFGIIEIIVKTNQ